MDFYMDVDVRATQDAYKDVSGRTTQEIKSSSCRVKHKDMLNNKLTPTERYITRQLIIRCAKTFFIKTEAANGHC
jgi:hypothetical protein